ncbi:30S ribosomal protein S9 [Candidatus Giovannonibacteria bacterium RIFCSPLOWO2_01_FULL_44_40]|uniref:Small ribosomal subunit protein uS9 n=1 Tax=Candidatus Giovannonibacteria bacterium RIFCSPHIGHO2_01_FULL_45_23 TaxID=1798325 RepID=A0A1F5VIF0_9BACT|nr:MAG: 30S ribosomal protein S9 [Candidatus Giovannonibacteria bacterium RIFCSPHIGHO2_01_FULL_45_23]OGF75815.1 MAG: 30S ribosomal protein S9 [Candidatus Giovannonibacteria bacterium RIFCSPHIGHO2_02_FULL_45_13]OGF80236.1 MAG: 30S ribosomal protein S9 [Candidatus Giovannonibacteria bacterium RIFCSPLOWO2_01_FULL_44_40]
MAKTDSAKYFEAVGRRKTSVARVRLFQDKTGKENILVNDKLHAVYFPTPTLKKISEDALRAVRQEGAFKVTAKIKGGGIHSQAEALRMGIARALLKADPLYRKTLKQLGFLKRDPRMKERRKFGLKKARKAPQWAKR